MQNKKDPIQRVADRFAYQLQKHTTKQIAQNIAQSFVPICQNDAYEEILDLQSDFENIEDSWILHELVRNQPQSQNLKAQMFDILNSIINEELTIGHLYQSIKLMAMQESPPVIEETDDSIYQNESDTKQSQNDVVLRLGNGLPMNYMITKNTVLIVNGFIRDIGKIPSDISVICCLFYKFRYELETHKATPLTILFVTFQKDLYTVLSFDGWESLEMAKQCKFLKESLFASTNQQNELVTDLIENVYFVDDKNYVSAIKKDVMMMISKYCNVDKSNNIVTRLIQYVIEELEENKMENAIIWKLIECFRQFSTESNILDCVWSDQYLNGFVQFCVNSIGINVMENVKELLLSINPAEEYDNNSPDIN